MCPKMNATRDSLDKKESKRSSAGVEGTHTVLRGSQRKIGTPCVSFPLSLTVLKTNMDTKIIKHPDS